VVGDARRQEADIEPSVVGTFGPTVGLVCSGTEAVMIARERAESIHSFWCVHRGQLLVAVAVVLASEVSVAARALVVGGEDRRTVKVLVFQRPMWDSQVRYARSHG
jgi:hypothetical protein